jgi:uncharacterized protein (UPF0332 family)
MGSSVKQQHIEHFKHNEGFLATVIAASPDRYFDWKVTIAFYCALHLVRAFLATKGIEESASHHHTLDCINPKPQTVPEAHVPLPNLYRPYSHLYLLSRNARYDGFLHAKEFEKHQRDKLAEAKDCVEKIKTELIAQGFKFPEQVAQAA